MIKSYDWLLYVYSIRYGGDIQARQISLPRSHTQIHMYILNIVEF